MSGLSKIQCAILLDTYQALLTDKQRDIMRMYCDMDYSLAEIAEQTGTTRQAVRDAIVNAERTLTDSEDKLHIVKDLRDNKQLLQTIKAYAEAGNCSSILQLLHEQCEE